MTTNDMVRARIDAYTKKEAARVLAGMGLTISDACRMTLTLIARDKALPFGKEACELSRKSVAMSELGEEVHQSSDVEALFRKLKR